MILIEEDKLIHTDSSEDILLHFGTKGMKWGVRKAAAYAKSYGRNVANNYRHPILSAKADLRVLSKGKLIPTHRMLDYRNKFVADRLAAKKQYKANKKAINEKFSKQEDRIGKMKGSESKIAKLENRNAEQHLAARKKLKDQYKKAKKSAGGNYKDAGRVK